MSLKFLSLALCIVAALGHVRMMQPPSRASAWRYGYDIPIDWNDDQAYCGGLTYQYAVNGGKCGICGDPWDEEPRMHEVGGPYATGAITATYNEGQMISVLADFTTQHKGHIKFNICPNNDVTTEADQDCLDLYPLYRPGASESLIWIEWREGNQSWPLQLPAGLSCSQCVLQMRYVGGNNWGVCANGTEGMGCGNQEEFRACADIAIEPTKGGSSQLLG